MTRIVTWSLAAVLIVGGIACWDLIPTAWFERLPLFGRIVVAACALIFAAVMLVGYLIDSGIPGRIFKRK